MKNFVESLSRLRGRSVAAACLGVLAAFGPMSASAGVALAELHGVAEQLGSHRLAVDGDELWALLLLVGVVVTLWVFHRKDRSK